MADNPKNTQGSMSGTVFMAALLTGGAAFAFGYFDDDRTLLQAADNAGITFAVTYLFGMLSATGNKSAEKAIKAKAPGRGRLNVQHSPRQAANRTKQTFSRDALIQQIKAFKAQKGQSHE